MVALTTGRLPRDAIRTIEKAHASLRGETPAGFEWADRLSAGHQRQFAAELYNALARLNLTLDPTELFELLEAWEATAEMDAVPEVREQVLNSPKHYRAWPAKRR